MSNEYRKFLNRDYTYLLRGVCMIMIIVGHTAPEFNEVLVRYHLSSIWICGCYATGIFLFLSGYGLTLSIRNNKIDKGYVVRHLKNLLVPYVVFWCFYIIVDFCIKGFCAPFNSVYKEFLFLKMPYVDTWFFRTILGIYILYFLWARFRKQSAEMGMTITVVVYVTILICLGVDSWWWNTLLCFPLGILFAVRPSFLRVENIRWMTLAVLLCLFIFSHKYIPNPTLKAIIPPIFCCLFFAYLSLKVRITKTKSVLRFIGQNSLYMYLMEEIPIDNIVPETLGLPLYIVCCLTATVILTYLGVKIETLSLKKLS